MKKRFLIFAVIVLSFYGIKAQSHIDELSVNVRSSFEYNHHSINDEDHKGFNGEHFNINMQGHITDNITYRIRQRFHKDMVKGNNFFNATDFLYIDWKINEHWSLNFGRQEIFIGGYEYDYAPIDVYFYGDFCNVLPECYGFAGSVAYNFNEHQQLVFQVSNSPFYGGNSNMLSYNLAWFGNIAPWWRTIWSVNESEYANGEFENMIALGNRIGTDNVYLEADFINRYRKDYKNFLLDNWGFVAKFNYTYNNFNFFVKGGYDKDKYRFLLHVGDNKFEYKHIGGGVEYFPLKDNKNVRLHAVYHYTQENLADVPNETKKYTHNVLIGATWKINVIKKIIHNIN